jgi:hypothetical protein
LQKELFFCLFDGNYFWKIFFFFCKSFPFAGIFLSLTHSLSFFKDIRFHASKEESENMPNGVESKISLKCQLFERSCFGGMNKDRGLFNDISFIQSSMNLLSLCLFVDFEAEDLENTKYGQVLELESKARLCDFFISNGFAMKVALAFQCLWTEFMMNLLRWWWTNHLILSQFLFLISPVQ